MEHHSAVSASRRAVETVRFGLGRAATAALILCVRAYRCTLSPAKTFLLGPLGGCRFEPSCSAYALEALRRHGAWAGSWLALKRIGRCHPWGGCGHDPVPEGKSEGRTPKPEMEQGRRGGFSLRGVLRTARPTWMQPQRH